MSEGLDRLLLVEGKSLLWLQQKIWGRGTAKVHLTLSLISA